MKKIQLPYKYTHNVNEYKGCIIFIAIGYGIYTREQPLTKLLHHYLREEHLNETKELWHEHNEIELITFNCTKVRLFLFLKLIIFSNFKWPFFGEAYSSIGNIHRWLKTKRRRRELVKGKFKEKVFYS